MWKMLDRSKGSVFGFEVEGKITAAEIEVGAAMMDKAIQEEDFEGAAELRDRVNELKERRDGTG